MASEIGNYALIAGIVIAIALGLELQALESASLFLWTVLIMLGIFVGLINISNKDSKDFLLYTTAMIIIGYVGNNSIDKLGNVRVIIFLKGILNSILAFVLPAGSVVALRQLWILAKR